MVGVNLVGRTAAGVDFVREIDGDEIYDAIDTKIGIAATLGSAGCTYFLETVWSYQPEKKRQKGWNGPPDLDEIPALLLQDEGCGFPPRANVMLEYRKGVRSVSLELLRQKGFREWRNLAEALAAEFASSAVAVIIPPSYT